MTATNHLDAVGWITFNKDFLKKLPPRYKYRIFRAVSQASEWATNQIIENEAVLLADLQQYGMTVTQPDAEAIREKAKPAVELLFDTEWPVTTWEEVLAQ